MKLLIAGMILSLIGSLPPGLISLSVAYTAISRGIIAALALSFGAAFAEFFQAWAAVWLSDWFLSHPEAGKIFEWVATIVFSILGAYLIFWARPPQQLQTPEMASNRRFFLKGVGISAFNLLAIPYWFTYCAWLRVEGWWQVDSTVNTLLFSVGVSIGTCLALALYAWLSSLMVARAATIARRANLMIGLLFWGLALKTLYKLFQ